MISIKIHIKDNIRFVSFLKTLFRLKSFTQNVTCYNTIRIISEYFVDICFQLIESIFFHKLYCNFRIGIYKLICFFFPCFSTHKVCITICPDWQMIKMRHRQLIHIRFLYIHIKSSNPFIICRVFIPHMIAYNLIIRRFL